MRRIPPKSVGKTKKRPGKTQPGRRNPKLDGKFPVPGKKPKPKKPGTPVIGPVKSRPVKEKFPVPGKKPKPKKPGTPVIGPVKSRPVKEKFPVPGKKRPGKKRPGKKRPPKYTLF